MLPPIAMMHYVTDEAAYQPLNGWRVSRKAFLRLLDYLEKHQYQTVTFADAAENKSDLRVSKNLILTFDDCAKHLLDFAVPQLLARKMKACFYVPTAHLGGYNEWDAEEYKVRIELMNEGDIKELSRLGMEVGGHSHHHIKLKDVSDAARVKDEVSTCKIILEKIIQKPVYSFAYPFASVPRGYKQILSSAGYRYALSIYYPFENQWALRRFGYYESDTDRALNFKLSKQYRWFRMLYDPVKKY